MPLTADVPSESGEISLVAQTTLSAPRVFPNVARPARLIDFAVVSAVRAPRRYVHNNNLDPTLFTRAVRDWQVALSSLNISARDWMEGN